MILNNEFSSFISHGFLNIYINSSKIKAEVIDGKVEDDSILIALEKGDEDFNLKQYQIEHYDPNNDLIVTAGAGTGKTHVMVNRIMFLMHYCDDFKFSDVAMITFTNKATDNMRKRLTNTLNSKFKLTGDITYLRRIEELSQITLSTIHSFFKKVLVNVSPMLGYGTNLDLTSYIYEKRQILLDLINERFNDSGKRVNNVIGLSVNEIIDLASLYWNKIDNNGITEFELKNMDWGKVSHSDEVYNNDSYLDPVLIQKTMIEILDQVNERYDELKFKRNAIGMSDIIHELSRVIQKEDIVDYLNQSYRFIFCDEFQDSDNIQIFTIVMLTRLFGSKLFVVGDIKQSIYRFRGATDSSFEELKKSLKNNGSNEPNNIKLDKNYRTSAQIMDKLDPKFRIWHDKRLLRDNGELKAMKHFDGSYKVIGYKKKYGKTLDEVYSELQIKLIEIIDRIKKDFEKKKCSEEKDNQNDNEKKNRSRTMILTRTNRQLLIVKRWCEQNNIVCHIKERGSFYKSDAVRDFCAMIEALLYNNEPSYLYNYVCSSYYDGRFDINDLDNLEYDKEKLVRSLHQIIGIDRIIKYRNDLNNRPAIAVINDIIDQAEPGSRYYNKQIEMHIKKGLNEEDAQRQSKIDQKVYEADLDKLLELLIEYFKGDFASLYDICSFIRMKILTDNNEEAADVEIDDNEFFIEGMTVHSSKGLEFDNVIIPFTDDNFIQDYRSELLISRENKRVGWKYVRRNGNEKSIVCNDNYLLMQTDENSEITQEETRLLYVAMTRAIRSLYCFCEKTKNSKSDEISCWSDLLWMGENR